jgi:hypothetical protein
MRRAAHRFYARQQKKFGSLGLTTRGTQRKRRTWPKLGALRGRARQTERQRRERAAFIAAGLNWRGKPRRWRRHEELLHLHGRERRLGLLKLLYREKMERRAETRVRALLAGRTVHFRK